MLASAHRSLVINKLGLVDRAQQQENASRAVLLDVPLDGHAVALEWDIVTRRIAVAVTAASGGFDRVCFLRTPASDSKMVDDIVTLPPGVGVQDLSLVSMPDDGTSWAVAACTDGTVRLLEASPEAPAKVVLTQQNHVVAATAAQLSNDLQCIVSGSQNGQVLLQPFSNSFSPKPLAGMADANGAAITGLRFSPLRPEVLAACDMAGRVQVWDTHTLKPACCFQEAHRGPVRSLSFSTHNEALLISGGDDAQLVFSDVRNSCVIKEVDVAMALNSLSYHADGYLLAAGTSTGAVLVFDLRMLASKEQPASPVQRFGLHQDRGGSKISALSFAPNSINLAKSIDSTTPISLCSSVASLLQAAESSQEDQHRREEEPSAEGPQMATTALGQVSASVSSGPTSATMQSLMNRLNTKMASSSSATSSVPPRTKARVVPEDNQVKTRALSASYQEPVDLQADGVVASASDIPRAPGAMTKVQPPHAIASVAPVTPSQTERQQRQQAPQLETPAQGQQAARYRIATSPDQVAAACSPWWSSEPTGMEGVSTTAGGHVSDIVEALRPLFLEMRAEISREVQESQCAIMEQNFRLHAELRKDVEELRAEVQQLRGELRVL